MMLEVEVVNCNIDWWCAQLRSMYTGPAIVVDLGYYFLHKCLAY